MIQRLLIWACILSIGFGGLFWFESTRLPCRLPLLYTIGQLDSRFSLSEDDLQSALAEAEQPWEALSGQDLFRPDPAATFHVNLIFDERQARTIDERKLVDAFDAVQSKQETIKGSYETVSQRLQQARQQYEDALAVFEKRLAQFNNRVAVWNQGARTDADELAWIQGREKQLRQDQVTLEALRTRVNVIVTEVNRYAREEQHIVERYQSQVQDFTETYGASGQFDQGIYDGTGINIYQFSDRDHLVMVLTHELGHALGLGHVDNAASIMYPVMSEQPIHNIVLSAEDQAAFTERCTVTVWDLLLRDSRAAWQVIFK